MEIQLINNDLTAQLHDKAKMSERMRIHFDFRTTSEDGSQRMLNALEVGTKVTIHRHTKSYESIVCLEGCFDVIFFEELPNIDAGGPVHNGETALDETCFGGQGTGTCPGAKNQ